MKQRTRTPLGYLLSLACLVLFTQGVKAAYNGMYWDPEGLRSDYSTYTGGSLAGSWENASWSSSANDKGQATPQVFTEGLAACFAVGAGATNSGTASSTTAFTVTLASPHTVAGFFIGALNPNSAIVTLSGNGGGIVLPGTGAGSLQGFNIHNSSDSSTGQLIINLPVSGAASPTFENNGQIFFNGTNSYSGNTLLGWSGASFTGVFNFNSPKALGTGSIVVSNTAGGIAGFVYTGTGAATITNKISWAALTGGINVVGTPAGLTFTNTVTLAAATTNAYLYTGGTGNLVNFTGVISGGKAGGVLNKGNASTLKLSAANTYALTTAISNGIVMAGNNGAIPSGSGKGDLIVATGLDGNNNPVTGKLDVNGFSVSCNGLFGDGIIDNTATGSGTLTAGNNNVTSTFTGTIQNTGGSLNFTKAGTGTLTLTGNNTQTGNTTITGGTLVVPGGHAQIPQTALTIAGGGTLDVQNNSMSFTNLSGRGDIVNIGNNTVTVSGNFTATNSLLTYSGYSGNFDNGSLIKNGTQAMAVRGPNNNLVNGIQLNGGALVVGGGSNRFLASGLGASLTTAAGTTFELAGSPGETLNQLSGSGTIDLEGGTLIVNSGTANSYSGVIRDSDLPGSSTALGHGLRGYYYTHQDFTALTAVRDDAQVYFTDLTQASNWPAAVFAANTNLQNLSVRWIGQVLAPVSGTYTFTAASDDGARLWVNGQCLVDNWVTKGIGTTNNTTGTITLNANTRYDIILEYFQQTGGAAAELLWTPPGDVVATAIPTDYLFLPGAGSLVKDGFAPLTLQAANSYSGTTVVKAGTLEAAADSALGLGNVIVQDGAVLLLDSGVANNYIADSADLILSGSAKVNLNFSGTDNVRALSFDGGATYVAAGTYGSSASSAQHKDDTHFDSSSAGVIRVGGLPSTTTLGSSTGSTVYGSQVTLTAVAHGSGAIPTGTITFLDGANAIGTVAVDGTGTAVLNVSDLTVTGSPHSITAVYNGDATYGMSSSAAVTQTVTALGLTAVTGNNKQYDQTTTATLNVNPVGVLPSDVNLVHLASGYTANFSDKNAGTNKTITVSGIALTGSLAGNYTIVGSTSTLGNISSKPLTVTNITSASKVYDGTVTATVNALNAGITGSATNIIYVGDDATPNYAAATGAFTNASVGVNKTVVVTVPMTGADAGNYSATGTVKTNITQATSSLALSSSANPANSGDNVSFTATVTPVAGGTATGNVVFLNNGVAFATTALSGNSANSGAITTLPVGTNTITAQYAGDTNVGGSTNTLQQVINNTVVQPPTMTITKSAGQITISWTGTFNLQSVNAMQSSGTPWQTIAGATSPYTTSVTNAAQYYRLSN